MGSKRRKDFNDEENSVYQALALFFAFLDSKSAVNLDPPPQVTDAFGVIAAYYTPRLKGVVRIFPSDCINRVVESKDLYQHAWLKLWQKGAGIRRRTPAGVCAWLKCVVIHHKINLKRSCFRLDRLDEHYDADGELYFDDVRTFMESWYLISETCDDFNEFQFRWQILQDLFGEGLAKLNARQQQIIKLDRDGYSLAEIMKSMQFPSISATSSFKSRSFKALQKQLYLLCVRELDNPRISLERKAIIEEWMNHYHITNRERKRNA